MMKKIILVLWILFSCVETLSADQVVRDSSITKSDTNYLDKIKSFLLIKNKPLVSRNNFQIGFWAGNSIYGGGDIKHKSLLGFGSEISSGVYLQYDLNNYISIKTNYYRSELSMHNLFTAFGRFGQGKVPIVLNNDNQMVQLYQNTWPMMFVTDLNIVDAELLWHFGNNVIKENQKGRWVNSIGLSVGFLSFDPYRVNYLNRNPGESKLEWDNRTWENERVSLRELNMGASINSSKKYSKYASNIGLSWQLSYLFQRWSFKGEIKAVYTSTDYIDDYGPGKWYGGDYDSWFQQIKSNPYFSNDRTLFTEDMTPTDKFYNVSGLKNTQDIISKDATRSTDGLNDWYYQFHIGVGYNISFKNSKKTIKSE
jgi:hypothetical protein